MSFSFIVLLFLICIYIYFLLTESSNTLINCVHLLEIKRKKTKKRNVPKRHQKVIAQPDVPEVLAGRGHYEFLALFLKLCLQRLTRL